MKKSILLLILLLFLASPVLADLYVAKDQEGKIIAITNQDIFKAEYQELGYTFELWLKAKTPTLNSLVKSFASQITGTQGDIRILDWTYYLDGNYYYVEGILKNVGKDEVEYIQIKAIAYDKSKKLVTLKQSYSNPADLRPGQEATFKIMVKYNSRIENFELRLNWKED